MGGQRERSLGNIVQNSEATKHWRIRILEEYLARKVRSLMAIRLFWNYESFFRLRSYERWVSMADRAGKDDNFPYLAV